jgi:hypothetical protein
VSEWQPARLVNAHKCNPYEEVRAVEGRVVMVRPTWVPRSLPRKCDSRRHFKIQGIKGLIFCEHEILTD